MWRERVIFMRTATIFPMGDSPALSFAVRALEKEGIAV